MNVFCKYFGHKYQARYHSSLERDLSARGITLSTIEALKTKTYVHDVCTRCGSIVNKRGEYQ